MPEHLTYFIITIVLIAIELIYFKLASHFNIIDKPNQRSSHSSITIRGGAIIIPIAFFITWIIGLVSWQLMLAITLVSVISFIDDIIGLHQIPRLVSHLVASLLIFYTVGLFGYSWYIQLMVLILLIGWINTFNFMDGINGIMVLYGLAILSTYYYLYEGFETMQEILLVVIIASIVFAYFNVRKKAKAFAGDVGSVSLAFILGYFLIDLIIKTGRFEYILFFSVFGIDSIATILFRLKRGENIFKAHRSHLYQYFSNELGYSHITVSVYYAVIQLIINILVIYSINSFTRPLLFNALLLISLSIIYLVLRYIVQNKID